VPHDDPGRTRRVPPLSSTPSGSPGPDSSTPDSGLGSQEDIAEITFTIPDAYEIIVKIGEGASGGGLQGASPGTGSGRRSCGITRHTRSSRRPSDFSLLSWSLNRADQTPWERLNLSRDVWIEAFRARRGHILVLTGAGVSAASGIPTFRGPEGYWKVGSRNFRPMELATASAFAELPDEVWGWYLYRRAVCHAARPNAAHLALATLEEGLGDRFLLVTQNVDGLHSRSGNSADRTFCIHGNIDLMRCARGCSRETPPIPDEISITWEKDRIPDESERALLTCRHCGSITRPHVLWFDECYDESWFRFESSLHAAARTNLLLVAGTSGATNLPTQIVMIAHQRSVPILVVDTEPTSFSELAESSGGGMLIRGPADVEIPGIVSQLLSSQEPQGNSKIQGS